MTNQKKIELLAEVFECDEEKLGPDTLIEEIGGMDSMTALSLIVMIDDECGKTLDRNQVKAFKKIGEIMQMME